MFDVKKRIGAFEKFEDADSMPGSVISTTSHLNIFSPVSVQSPHVEFDNLEQVKFRLVRDMMPAGKNTDWIWDWSSRPEAYPPKCVRVRQYGSNLTTPPNSPEPELMTIFAYDVEPKSMSLTVVVSFIVSNVITFVIGAAIGLVSVTVLYTFCFLLLN
ncbi:unnamed protein product [Strongylus vulgaris]|uniref:Uncharacterized protein n=1 Tax=Strongylus vulgaris TaxID=40348 RepID=A0A3P7JL70_STRVU|nr:unnamed protein product [Strongylus vulgaris]